MRCRVTKGAVLALRISLRVLNRGRGEAIRWYHYTGTLGDADRGQRIP